MPKPLGWHHHDGGARRLQWFGPDILTSSLPSIKSWGAFVIPTVGWIDLHTMHGHKQTTTPQTAHKSIARTWRHHTASISADQGLGAYLTLYLLATKQCHCILAERACCVVRKPLCFMAFPI